MSYSIARAGTDGPGRPEMETWVGEHSGESELIWAVGTPGGMATSQEALPYCAHDG